MDKISIKKLLDQAVESLFANQPNIFDFTSETGQTEWNLAHHLANQIHKSLPRFDCDLEVIKINLKNKRPDIIFHKRGTHKKNMLIVELKRDGDSRQMEMDVERIRSYWFGHPLRYKFGSAINIRSDKTYEVEVIERTENTEWTH